MAFQSTFKGRVNVSQTNELKQIAEALRTSITPALNKYADYKGKEITKKTTDEAEIAARETDVKSYAEAVKNGTLDGTQSPYWQSVFDNAKGKAYGINYGIQKQTSLNEWINTNKAEDENWIDKDGSQYMAWSNDYDAEYFSQNLEMESVFFKKGLDTYVTQTNANLGNSYAASMREDQKAVMMKNISTIVTEGFDQFSMSGDVTELYEAIDAEGGNATMLAGIQGAEFNSLVLDTAMGVVSELTIKGDPDADYEKALSIIEAVNNYKRDNGSTLFNAETKENFSNFEQTVRSEMEGHEVIMEKNEIEFMQLDWIEDQRKLMGSAFGGIMYATYAGEDGAKVAMFAEDAYTNIIKKVFLDEAGKGYLLDPRKEEDMVRIKELSTDVFDSVKAYYKTIDASQLVPFDYKMWKAGKMPVGVNMIDNQFNSKVEFDNAVTLWEESGIGPFKDLMDDNNIDYEYIESLMANQARKLDIMLIDMENDN